MVLERHNRGEALRRKLRSRSGMTLAELLVSMALMALLTVGVGVGVSATGPVLRDTIMLSESQLLLDTMTKAISGELRYATGVRPLAAGALPPSAAGEIGTFPGDAPFSYSSKEYGEYVALYNVEKDDGSIWVRIVVGTEDYDLIGSGAFSNLGVRLTQLKHDAGNESFAVTLQIVFPDGTTQDHSFAVRSVVK